MLCTSILSGSICNYHSMPDSSEPLSFAWISRGRLFVKRSGAPVTEIESEFAHNALERDAKLSANNAWKGRSGVWGSMGMEPPGMAPWEAADQRRNIRFVTAARGDSPDEIYYVLDMGAVGGLFRYDMELDEETRLMHRQGFIAIDISRHPDDGELAVSLMREDGTVGLSIARHDGLFGRTLTLSDSVDEAPCWLPDGSKKLLFQSSAIGRNEHGMMVGKSCYRIERLDLETEQIENLHESEGVDLLQPRAQQDGSILVIQRPYRSGHQQAPTLWEVTQDVLLFPFRLARTFIYFFNFMSMAFTGKPLINAGGPDQKRQLQPLMMLYGQAIDTQQALAKGKGGNADKPLVPKEWQLVRKSSDGADEQLAECVLSFDASHAGDVIYTDGRKVYRLFRDGRKETLADGDLIEKVILLS